jgi:disulfide bond formation protein DsbB
MFGFSLADWLFVGFILLVIVLCVALSDMHKKKA